ncbi:RHS repeat-associated core domain-containing protein [Deltaproteobacteria bacterium TL4]
MKITKGYYVICVVFLSVFLMGMGGGAPEPPTIPASGLTFVDTDGDPKELAGTVTIQSASDESDITEYQLYWAISETQRADLSEPLATIPADGRSSYTYQLPENTKLFYSIQTLQPATHLIVFTKNADGRMEEGVSTPILDKVYSTQTAANINFEDKDPDLEEIEGVLTITPSSDETSIEEYVIYWGANASDKLSENTYIASYPKTGTEITHTFAPNTPLPADATHILVFTKNSVGEMLTGTSTVIKDSTTTSPFTGINFADGNTDFGLCIGGKWSIQTTDESQILKHDVRIYGTPYFLHYQSDRVPGGKNTIFSINLTQTVIPEGVDLVRLGINIAGRMTGKEFKAVPQSQYQYEWDGTDGYGNFVDGVTTARIGVGYVNSATGQTQWNVYTHHITNSTAKNLGLGGWSLKIHHFYDKQTQTLYLGNGSERKITKTIPLFGEYANTLNIVSLDGSQAYIFNELGLHLKTLNTTNGKILYQFTYDSSGYLTQIEERHSKLFSSTLETTQIQRNGSRLSAIIASNGKITNMELDAQGYLNHITSPSGRMFQFHYADNGLMDRFTDAKNQITQYTFDKKGRLKTVKDALGGIWDKTSGVTQTGSQIMTQTSPMGRISTIETGKPNVGHYYQTNTTPSGEATTTQLMSPNTVATTSTNGMMTFTKVTSDPRWEDQTLNLEQNRVITPSGLQSDIMVTRDASYSAPGDPLSIESQTETVITNGRASTQTYLTENRTQTSISAAGRKTILTYNEFGKIMSQETPGLKKVLYAYDEQQRVKNVTQGDRTYHFIYNANGEIESVVDPLLRVNKLKYDANGLPVIRITPDLYTIQTSYDGNDNIKTIQPPGRDPYSFEYNSVNLPTKFFAPAIGIQQYVTQYAYNLDRQPEFMTFPDGRTLDYVYDSESANLSKLITPRGEISYTYFLSTSQPQTITTSDGANLSYLYDGDLLKEEQWTGVISGKVNLEYNNDFQITSRKVNGSSQISFTYDKDGIITNAGLLTLTLDSNTGALSGTTLGQINTVHFYNDFGELAEYRVESEGNILYQISYLYDKLGQVSQKTESINGEVITHKYEYDAGNRIKNVYENDIKTEQITYDSNGNRSNYKVGSKYFNSTFDKQDRLTWYAGGTYQYTLNGDLKRKTTKENLTTQYDYDVLGNLRSVAQPDGKQIEYLIDGKNRRIGKKVDGILTQGFLYKDQLNPIVELNGNGQVVSRFVYADKEHVPAYMIKGDKTYRIISDHLGSVRLVLDSDTGTIVQRMDYGTFGNVIQDTNPGFQPFGFAGGLYDDDTKLVRFGARDYDTEIGRWTTKDPIGFNGGDTNLYAYVGSDPINSIDPTGTLQQNARTLTSEEQVQKFILGLAALEWSVINIKNGGQLGWFYLVGRFVLSTLNRLSQGAISGVTPEGAQFFKGIKTLFNVAIIGGVGLSVLNWFDQVCQKPGIECLGHVKNPGAGGSSTTQGEGTVLEDPSLKNRHTMCEESIPNPEEECTHLVNKSSGTTSNGIHIPYSEDFPCAKYPYGQFPNGCSGWTSTEQVRDHWGPVNFTGACDNHDRCFYTIGSTAEGCNKKFARDLENACDSDLEVDVYDPIFGNYQGTIDGKLNPLYPECLSIAATYASVVATVAGPNSHIFSDAQQCQSQYESYVRDYENYIQQKGGQ